MSHQHHQKILPVLGNSILESFHLLLRGLWGGNAPLELTLHALLQHDGVLSANLERKGKESRILLEKFTILKVALVVLPYRLQRVSFFVVVRTIIPLCNIPVWYVACTLINKGPKRGVSKESHRRTILGSWENLYTSLHKKKKKKFKEQFTEGGNVMGKRCGNPVNKTFE